jgi:hypothetical protein
MASGVENMTIAQVRRALQQIRDRWHTHSPATPICPSDFLFNGMTQEEFSARFSLDQHRRRHNKSATSRKAATSGGGNARRSP